MKFLILGAGGVGGYFGGRLAASGADVTFVVRPKRQEQVRSQGLIIESPLGDLNIAANTVTAAELKPGYDVVLLTCKAYDLDASMDSRADDHELAEKDPGFTGFHRIEYGLWVENSTRTDSGATPSARKPATASRTPSTNGWTNPG